MAKQSKFEAAGYVRCDAPTTKRLIIGIDGDWKTGKLHFALTGPAPIALISTDIGTDGVVQKFQEGKEIWAIEEKVDMQELKGLAVNDAAGEARKSINRIIKAYEDVLGEARTIIWDKATEIWEILRMAEFGKLEKVMPHHYAPVNAKFKSYLRMAYDQEKSNLILIHDIKEVYINDKATGNKARSGFGATGGLVQVNALCWKDRDPNVGVPDRYHMNVYDCRHNPEIEGMDLSGADCNFPTLAQLIFPETNAKEWE